MHVCLVDIGQEAIDAFVPKVPIVVGLRYGPQFWKSVENMLKLQARAGYLSGSQQGICIARDTKSCTRTVFSP